MASDFIRQRDIIQREGLNSKLCVVGAGAIGSYTVLNLCKMGYTGEITVYDDDTIEDHNIPNQFYRPTAAKSSKVFELNIACHDMTDRGITPIPARLDAIPDGHEAVVLSVDDMDTRIQLYKTLPTSVRWLFDGRMGAEVMRIYTIDMNKVEDKEVYESNLYSSAEAEQLPCTAQAVIYNVSVIAGLLTNQIKRALLNQTYNREIIFALQNLELIKS